MSKRLRDKEAWIVTAKREQKYEKEHPEHIEERIAELRRIREEKNMNMTKAEQAALNAYDTNTPATIRIAYRDGYEQCEKDIIDRACEWLFSHLPILVDYYNEDIHTNADRSEFIKLFRTQMEDEK